MENTDRMTDRRGSWNSYLDVDVGILHISKKSSSKKLENLTQGRRDFTEPTHMVGYMYIWTYEGFYKLLLCIPTYVCT